MTKDEIIEMAMEADFVSHGKPSEEESELFVCTDKDIVRFYNLVAAKAEAKERESCAKVCDVLAVHPEYASSITKLAAQAIRNRGQS